MFPQLRLYWSYSLTEMLLPSCDLGSSWKDGKDGRWKETHGTSQGDALTSAGVGYWTAESLMLDRPPPKITKSVNPLPPCPPNYATHCHIQPLLESLLGWWIHHFAQGLLLVTSKMFVLNDLHHPHGKGRHTTLLWRDGCFSSSFLTGSQVGLSQLIFFFSWFCILFSFFFSLFLSIPQKSPIVLHNSCLLSKAKLPKVSQPTLQKCQGCIHPCCSDPSCP